MMQVSSKRRGITFIPIILVVVLLVMIYSYIRSFVDDTMRDSRNEDRNEAVLAYTRALDLMRTDSGAYPTQEAACLGDYSDDRCWRLDGQDGGDVLENARFTNRLEAFVKFPDIETVRGTHGEATTAYEGMIYQAPLRRSYGYKIEWMLEGADAACGHGAETMPAYDRFDITRCIYTHP